MLVPSSSAGSCERREAFAFCIRAPGLQRTEPTTGVGLGRARVSDGHDDVGGRSELGYMEIWIGRVTRRCTVPRCGVAGWMAGWSEARKAWQPHAAEQMVAASVDEWEWYAAGG